MRLKKSKAVFIADPHGYAIGKKQLCGITTLIHQALGLGYGDDTPDIVKDFYLPRAAEYGTSVHKAIEQFDEYGVKITSFPKSECFQEYPGDETWEVDQELESYIRNRKGFLPVANEYTVTDGERYASNIDNVWLKKETKGIWLVDTKTNNKSSYPGGVMSLKEYLSWQLSCYAYMFELQNPKLKVEGLAANWLRKDESEFWLIDRKSDDDVKTLLSCPHVFEDGKFVIDGIGAAQLRAALPAKRADIELVAQKTVDAIYLLLKQKEEAENKVAELKDRLREEMLTHGIKTWDSNRFRATLGAESQSETFDTKSFKKDHPDLYELYTKTTTRKGSFTIKLKSEQPPLLPEL